MALPGQGHNTPLPLGRSPPASFKRLLGGTTGRVLQYTLKGWRQCRTSGYLYVVIVEVTDHVKGQIARAVKPRELDVCVLAAGEEFWKPFRSDLKIGRAHV